MDYRGLVVRGQAPVHVTLPPEVSDEPEPPEAPDVDGIEDDDAN